MATTRVVVGALPGDGWVVRHRGEDGRDDTVEPLIGWAVMSDGTVVALVHFADGEGELITGFSNATVERAG